MINPGADPSVLPGRPARAATGSSSIPPVPNTHGPKPDDPKPVFSNIDAFVRGYLTQVVERRIAVGATAGLYWCPRWWAHPEGISRLYCLWRVWETLRVSDPQTGMSLWWRDHFDPHFAALTSEVGPFSRCRPDRHVDPQPLPSEPAPPEILAQFYDGG
ncbi:DUF4913 domain-containing protein [Dactylosporangium sp. NPDC050688]|uniref:DUF4913 domain-containing protein n=1 Tax=Dactylosporangium sp. NPDC050688 TaxID=3157217 RepID=UPI0033FE4BEF